MIHRAVAASWRLSSARYGGRSWPLAAVMLSNLTSVVLFGGGLMLILVATAEYLLCSSRRRSGTPGSPVRSGGPSPPTGPWRLCASRRAGVRDRPAERRLPSPLSHLRPLTREATTWSDA